MLTDVCKKCKCSLLDLFHLCYLCDYTEEQRRSIDLKNSVKYYSISDMTYDITEELEKPAAKPVATSKRRPAFVIQLQTISEDKCYCGDKSCDRQCGVLSCGCIDCCRCGEKF